MPGSEEKDEGEEWKDEGGRMKDESDARPSAAFVWLILHPSSFRLH
jgi:hypothetical protein